MKLEPVSLDELTTQSKDYKVKVKVAEKGRAQPSPKKPGVTFQSIILEDEKKNKMRCVLFGDQIQAYEHVFAKDANYEISKAPITVVEDQYKFNLEERPYQMTIGQQTVVQRLDPQIGPILPKYQSLATIPRALEPHNRYDVVVVVLFVEDQPRMVPNIRGRESPVREIMITDTSQERPITISAWNDLAGKPCEALTNWAEKFHIVGFTALKSRLTKVFSLNTTMSTRFIREPQGEKADALREWAKMNPQLLLERQERVLNIRYPSTEKKIVTIADLRSRKPATTMQEEFAWIQVTIPEPDLDRVHAYIGCSGCGKRTSIPVGTPFPCNFCKKPNTSSAHRVAFKFDCADTTGVMSFTAFNNDTEKLFRMPAIEICSIKYTGNAAAFQPIQQLISTKPFLIKVVPTEELERNDVLLWTLKEIEIPEEQRQSEQIAPSSANLSHQQIPTPIEKARHTEPLNLESANATAKEKQTEQELLMEIQAHGKEPMTWEDPPALDDEVLAQLVQFEAHKVPGATHEKTGVDPRERKLGALKIPGITDSKRALPTWTQLSCTRSSTKNKKPMIPDVPTTTPDENPVQKKVRTALFQDSDDQKDSDKQASPTSTLDQV